MSISQALMIVAMILLVMPSSLSLRNRLRIGVGLSAVVAFPAYWQLILMLLTGELVIERLQSICRQRSQQKAFRAYWPWLVDLMRIAISG